MGQRTEEAMEEKHTRGKMRKMDEGVPLKGKASFHHPRWPSLPLRQQISHRIARPKPGLAMKIVDRDKSSATGGRTIGRRQMLMQGQSIERCNNLLDMVMVKSPLVDIIGTCMDPPQAEILGNCMH